MPFTMLTAFDTAAIFQELTLGTIAAKRKSDKWVRTVVSVVWKRDVSAALSQEPDRACPLQESFRAIRSSRILCGSG